MAVYDRNTNTEVLSGLFAGRYAIEREIGRGATAIVFLARDTETARPVALKVLRDILVESRSVPQFLREIELHRGLTHPNIVPVLDSGTSDGRPYIVHPYLDGGTLRTRLQSERQLPFREVIAIGTALAEALAYAHKAGLIHRDVKPENILFADGRAHLSDFGIARALERMTGDVTTSTGVVRGTPAYVSPEQAGGQVDYDGRSDVYSLGCVLYEMVAGVQPFVGPTPQSVIAQRISFKPTPVAQYRDTIPVDLEAIIDRSMMMAPADRYQSAGELLAALRSAGTEPSDPTRRVTVKPTRRGPWVLAVAGVAAVALAALATLLPDDTPVGIPEGDYRRVAVLYLKSNTPDVLPEYIADGITEDLIDQLGGVKNLHVTSPDGVRPFRIGAPSVDSIKQSLKVGTIVSGSVARSLNTLRVDVRLVDAASGTQIESMQLEEPWTELFALQDQLAEQVQYWLRTRIGERVAWRANRAATSSVASWDTVQLASREVRRAIQAAATRGDTSSVRLFLRADSLYDRASVLDRDWILPIVRRGNLALLALAARSPVPPNVGDSARYAVMTPPERTRLWVERAHELAIQALAKKRRDPLALALLGQSELTLAASMPDRRDSLLASAERNLRTALQERPDNAPSWSALAELLVQRGQYLEGAVAAKNAFEADAFFEVRRVLGIAFSASLAARQFEDARKWCRLGLSYYPGDPRFSECNLRIMGSGATTRSAASEAWTELGRIEAADSLGILKPTWGYRRLMVAAILARSGLQDSARAVLSAVTRQQPAEAQASSRPAEAWVHLLLGDSDRAVQVLADYLRTLPPGRGTPILMHWWFESVRSDPRLDSLSR